MACVFAKVCKKNACVFVKVCKKKKKYANMKYGCA